MASVFTSSIPTDTLFDFQTITSESTFRSRARVTQLTTITQEEVELDEDGDLVTVTSEIVTAILSTSTSTGTRTRTITSSIPVQTLYSLSLSTSSPVSPTSPSLSLSRQPLIPTSSSSSSTSEDDVVVVTQFTTITPTQATTTSLSPTLSSGTSRSAVFPNGGKSSSSSNNRGAASAANDDAASSRSSSSSSLSSGAIAGITVGAIAVAILLGILGFLFCCRRRRNRRDSMYATTGGRSDEKLATALFNNPDYSYNSTPQATRTRSSGGNSRHQLLMANVGGAGTSSITAGAAGIGAGRSGSNNSNRFSAGGREDRNYQTYGKNKPVPDVPPPVSTLQYMRPAPGHGGILDGSGNGYSDSPNRVHYANQPMAAAGMIGRPSTASPTLATQRTSAPQRNTSLPVQTAEERSEALKRAKSVASIASIPIENLGKGSGYASPMAPIDPLGKPIDQKTWRERTSKIHSGEFFTPDTMLTKEQKLRRDSQLAKLQALRDGTASSKPNLTKLKEEQEKEEIVETSPLLGGDNSFDSNPFNSPEKVSAMYPLQNQTSRGSQRSASKRPDSTATVLPYINNAEASTSYRPPSSPLPPIPQQPPRSPPPSNTIYPSLPPNSPSRSAALSQSTSAASPTKQPRYELHQPLAQSHNPIRASFISAPHQSQTIPGGPPPAPSSQAFNNRLPVIPGSRPSSMITSNTTLPEYRRSSATSFVGAGSGGNNAQTPYDAAATASPQPTPFFHQHNGSNGSFGTSRSSQNQQVSLADEIYGGLTKGLSERDLLRLSQPLQPQNRK